MKHELEFKGLEPTPEIRNLFEKKIAHLERKSKGLSNYFLFLRGVLEEVPIHKLFRVSLVLEVPQKTLSVTEEKRDADSAIHSAFAELETRLAKYKSEFRGEHWWKRVERRRELKLLKSGALPSVATEDPQWFFTLVEPHLEKLREIVGHVLHYVEERGDLPQNDLEVDEVIDAALARAYDQFKKDRSPDEIRSRLVRFALDEIKAEVKRAQQERTRFASVEQPLPLTPPTEEVSWLGEEILDFYQPDATLKVEDILPDLQIPPPDQVVETKELRQCVRNTLNRLSVDARRALVLRYVVGLRGKELAKSLNKPEDEVERLLDNARARLRDELIAAGCVVNANTPA